MKPLALALFAGVLLAGCSQTAPVTSTPAAAPAAAPAPVAAADSAPVPAAPAAAPVTATAPAPVAALAKSETLKLSFVFRPVPDPDDAAHPRTSAHLLLQGAHPQDIDLGKFAGKPDVVNAVKAKAANFPSEMVMGFRSYQAATGTSADLAVLHVDGRRLRIVQRRVEEAAPEAGEFKTAREIPLPANTVVVAAQPAARP